MIRKISIFSDAFLLMGSRLTIFSEKTLRVLLHFIVDFFRNFLDRSDFWHDYFIALTMV